MMAAMVGPHLSLTLEHFSDAKRNGNGFMACCPAHEDKTPSLSISEGEDGCVLLKCHAGCTIEKVLKAIGLKMGDLFPNGPSGEIHGPPIKEKSQPAPIGETRVDQFHAALSGGARNYLKQERVLTDAVIDRYLLGLQELNGERRATSPFETNKAESATCAAGCSLKLVSTNRRR